MTKTEQLQLQLQETKIDGIYRIVALGDSLAYGAGDENGGGIAERVEAELARNGLGRVASTNLGVNGAQTGELIARLETRRVREVLADADAIVLSIGANDLFRSPKAREQTLAAPLAVAEKILERIAQIVTEIHRINPDAHVLILGGYNPIPTHPYASMINDYLELWDGALAAKFENEPRVAVVRMSDLVTRDRLSRYDSFHPGGAAYAAAARRIAAMLAGRSA